MSDSQPNSPPLLLSWLRLLRLPNVFTAVADIAMGYLIVRREIDLPGAFACLMFASACVYTAGMVLNDVFDFDTDSQERPFRPLPAGQISLRWARYIGVALLLVGTGLGIAAGHLGTPAETIARPWRSGIVVLILAGSVLAYDGFLKRTLLGPLGMGFCRFFNVLLGMSVADQVALPPWPLGYDLTNLGPATGIGVYIVGVTCFARGEAGRSPVLQLLLGSIIMTGGIVILGWSAQFFQRPELKIEVFWWLLALLQVFVLRRCLPAITNPQPHNVQAAVKQSILSLILFDASLCAAASNPMYALAVAMLLAPMLFLGRWVYST